jgi:hypothetical protein
VGSWRDDMTASAGSYVSSAFSYKSTNLSASTVNKGDRASGDRTAGGQTPRSGLPDGRCRDLSTSGTEQLDNSASTVHAPGSTHTHCLVLPQHICPVPRLTCVMPLSPLQPTDLDTQSQRSGRLLGNNRQYQLPVPGPRWKSESP